MWPKRSTVWHTIETTPEWDVLVVGGGITGAGILREASRAGLRALLIEQKDFAWGTSSRSSKMVHGGLRYLAHGQLGVTYQSVKERQNLLQAGEGLITPLGFLMPAYKGGGSKWVYKAALSIYDLMAMRWDHREYNADEMSMLAPRINREGLQGGFAFEDAQTDDARLVLRVMQEALADGGTALNYVRAETLLKEDGRVTGLRVCDAETGTQVDVKARVVINAAGAWVDHLRGQVGGEKRIRPLRGSHLIFPAWRFPVAQAVSFSHPWDRRPVFVYPWEGVTLIGTTDLDHTVDLSREPQITGEEVAYLMAACQHQFPALALTLDDILSTYSGVRPVIGTGKERPSDEARDHMVWLEQGLLSVTGGKLTTYRVLGLEALHMAAPLFDSHPVFDTDAPALNPVGDMLPSLPLTPEARQRLIGRYGENAVDLVASAHADDMTPIPHTPTLWIELRWAAHAEEVVHLDDLLLRRTRIGLLLPQGGMGIMDDIRAICQPQLGWDDARWASEVERYQALWQQHYSLPPRESIPDWTATTPTLTAKHKRRVWRRPLIALLVAAGAALVVRGARKRS